jgi:hypothetical protein
MALARAMSEPTSAARWRWAQRALEVFRGSMTCSRAPFPSAFRTWWKKIGWVSRALDPHRRMTSVSSISR